MHFFFKFVRMYYFNQTNQRRTISKRISSSASIRRTHNVPCPVLITAPILSTVSIVRLPSYSPQAGTSAGPFAAPLPSINNPPSDVHYVVKFRLGLISTVPLHAEPNKRVRPQRYKPGNITCRVKRSRMLQLIKHIKISANKE